MSIILKGIDLPKDREFILLKVFPDGKTRIGLSTNYTQAIQIPTPHGRLIDADALVVVFKDMAKCEWNQKAFPISWAYAFEDTIDEIQEAPTILETEEE